MKRRTFVLTSCLAAVSIPFLGYLWLTSNSSNPLTDPEELSLFCDKKTIYEMGIQYRKKMPSENSKEKLKELLLNDNRGNKIKPTDSSEIVQLLNAKIHTEFSEYKTIILTEWVVSITEGRQCALASLTQKLK